MDSGDTQLIVGTTTSGAEELAKKAPKALVVCAFNTVPSEVLFGVFEARRKKLGRAWCTAAMTRAPKMWWPR
jgi:predicted dinucleotide-binding enzyme